MPQHREAYPRQAVSTAHPTPPVYPDLPVHAYSAQRPSSALRKPTPPCLPSLRCGCLIGLAPAFTALWMSYRTGNGASCSVPVGAILNTHSYRVCHGYVSPAIQAGCDHLTHPACALPPPAPILDTNDADYRLSVRFLCLLGECEYAKGPTRFSAFSGGAFVCLHSIPASVS